MQHNLALKKLVSATHFLSCSYFLILMNIWLHIICNILILTLCSVFFSVTGHPSHLFFFFSHSSFWWFKYFRHMTRKLWTVNTQQHVCLFIHAFSPYKCSYSWHYLLFCISCYTVFTSVVPECVLSGLFYCILRYMTNICSMFVLHCLEVRKIKYFLKQ